MRPEIPPAYVYVYTDNASVDRCVFSEKADRSVTDNSNKTFLEKYVGTDVDALKSKMLEVAEEASEATARKPHTVENITFWCLNDGETKADPRFVVKNPAGLAVMVKLQTTETAIAKFRKTTQQRISILDRLEGFYLEEKSDDGSSVRSDV